VKVRVRAAELPSSDEVYVVSFSSGGERETCGVMFVDEVYVGPEWPPSKLDRSSLPLEVEVDVIDVVEDDGKLCCYICIPTISSTLKRGA